MLLNYDSYYNSKVQFEDPDSNKTVKFPSESPVSLVSILKNGNPTNVKPKTQTDSEIIANKDKAQYAAGIRGNVGLIM